MANENIIRIRIEECEHRKYFFSKTEPNEADLSNLSNWFELSDDTTPPNNTNNGSE